MSDVHKVPAALSFRSVADLVVVLQKDHELAGGQAMSTAAVVALSKRRIASVKHVWMLQCLCQIGEGAEILVIAGQLTGQNAVERMMEIIAPLRVDAVAAGFRCPHKSRIVQVAFGDQQQLPSQLLCKFAR